MAKESKLFTLKKDKELLEALKGKTITAYAFDEQRRSTIFLEMDSDGDNIIRIDVKNGEIHISVSV